MTAIEEKAKALEPTGDRLRDMIELYDTGASLSEVGCAFGITRQAVYERFKKAGVPIRNKHQAAQVKREEILERLLSVEDDVRKALIEGETVAEVAAKFSLPAPEVRRIYNHLPLMMRPPRTGQVITYPDEDLLSAITTVAEACGRTPSIQTYKEVYKELDNLPHAMTIVKRFGSWSVALEKAGLTPNNRPASIRMGAQGVTDAEIAQELFRIAGILGHPPSEVEFRQHSANGPSSSTIKMRYGSWRKAITAHFA